MSDQEDSMQFVWKHWPKLRSYVPADAVSFAGQFIGYSHGLCTHLDLLDGYWIHSRGGKKFMAEQMLPESFFCLGTQDRNTEYLFAMWYRNGRRLWFYDQYFVPIAKSSSSKEETRDKLDAVLERWETTAGHVIFSGIHGWFDPQTRLFKNDSLSGTYVEDWDRVKRPPDGFKLTTEG